MRNEYNSDILTDSKANFIFKNKKIGDSVVVDFSFKTDKNTNIIALNNRLNELKYMVDLSILEPDIAINQLYIEAMNLGLNILEIDIKIQDNKLIINEFLEG